MQSHVLDNIDPRALGRRLQEARKARGLTQKEVAEALDIARTTVTAIEKGERRIRAEELVRLADVYGRAVSDFVSSRETAQDFAVQFRTSLAGLDSPTSRQDMQRSVYEFQRRCEDYRFLENLTGNTIHRYYPPEYRIEGTAPDDAAEDVASFERNRLGLGDGPVLALRNLLENEVGVRVFYIACPARVAGMFAYTHDLGGCIGVNSHHPEERRRWSLAHEYGHFLTQRYESEVTVLKSYSRVPASERFADAFARCMLIPAAGLRRRFNTISRETAGRITASEVCRLAYDYFVSVEAMMLRLEELRLLPGGTWDRLRYKGFKVREAQSELGLVPHNSDDQLLPMRYRMLAVRLYEEGMLTEGELARLLRVDRVLARRTVQRFSNPMHLLDEGQITSLPIELSSTIVDDPS